MPQPPHEPTPETRARVEALSGIGMPQEEIGPMIGISDKTLRKYYDHELTIGRTKIHARVAQFIFNAATGRALEQKNSGAKFADCLRAAIFIAKTQMIWRETDTLEVTNPDGSMGAAMAGYQAAVVAAIKARNGKADKADE